MGPEDTWPSRAWALPAAGQAGVRPLGPLGPRESAREQSGPKRSPPRAARTGPRKERGAPQPARPGALPGSPEPRALGGAEPLGDPRASAAPQGLSLIPRSPWATLEESGRNYKRNLPPPGWGADFLAPSPTSRDACGLSTPPRFWDTRQGSSDSSHSHLETARATVRPASSRLF